MIKIKYFIGRIHSEGWKFFLILFTGSLLFLNLFIPISIIGFLFSFFTLWFFRDPDRETPYGHNLVISSADGRVCLIDKAYPPAEVGMDSNQMLRICVFMNVFNVHINRSPIRGNIENIFYKKGHFFNASLDKASEKNERSSMVIKSNAGKKLVVVQIAGLIARRIVSFVSDGKNLDAGEKFGLIRFGSRVDIYMPLSTTIQCSVGDKVVAGVSVLARLQDRP